MKRFEMLWDCGFCGTDKLLGVTHRHCPNCGGAQDPKARYFPPKGQEVAVVGHVYVGVDRTCTACGTAGSAKINFCGSCGCPMDGAKEVDLIQNSTASNSQVQSQQVAADTPGSKSKGSREGHKNRADFLDRKAKTPKPKSRKESAEYQAMIAKGNRQLKVIGCGLFVIILGVVASFLVTFEKKVVVTDHTWKRAITVQAFTRDDRANECAVVPSDGVITHRYDEERSREVAVGETCTPSCTTVNVDMGDGSFSSQEQCTDSCVTDYETEYYTVNMCSYHVGVWKIARVENTQGDLSVEPKWPKIRFAKSSGRYGEERERERKATYMLALEANDEGEVDRMTCELADLAAWRSFKKGQEIVVKQNIFGSVTCPQNAPVQLAH